jgi:threonine dehydrogenase-like Zn-dependent dehydrogenase
MAATYAESYTLAHTDAFQERLRIAALLVANANLNNPSEAIQGWNKRVIHSWGSYVDVVAEATAANPTITTASTDAQVNTVLTALWPTLAGITA